MASELRLITDWEGHGDGVRWLTYLWIIRTVGWSRTKWCLEIGACGLTFTFCHFTIPTRRIIPHCYYITVYISHRRPFEAPFT